jgi:hypothetical protein
MARLKTLPSKLTSIKPNGLLRFQRFAFDFDDDGWRTYTSPVTARPAFFTTTMADGTFTDVAVTAGAAFNEDGREQAGMDPPLPTMMATVNSTSSKPIFQMIRRRSIETRGMELLMMQHLPRLGLYTQYSWLGHDVL